MFENIWWVQGNWKDDINGLRKMQSESDYDFMTITKLLFVLRDVPLSFTSLYYKSGIKHKMSFLKYLKLLDEMDMISKTRSGINVYYSMTDKGKIFLDMVSNRK